jgi:hypothetical protein
MKYYSGAERDRCNQCVFFEFEITMLLNILYLSLVQPLEKRNDILHSKFQTIIQWLRNNTGGIQSEYRHSDDGYLKHLRNGLAHLDIQIDVPAQSHIVENSEIVILGKDKHHPTIIRCAFHFNLKQLRNFVAFILNILINDNIIDNDSNCKGCPHKGRMSFDVLGQ